MKNPPNLLIIVAIMMFLVLGCSVSEEEIAISQLHTLHGSQATYLATIGEGNFATSFDKLVDQYLIDSSFRGVEPQKEGYVFSMRVVPKGGADRKAKFSVNADPAPVGIFAQLERFLDSRKRRHLYLDESGSIHHSEGRPATAEDPVL